ncbi:MAG: PQQ-binding-like beta-propeller repeat protein [Planctomycetes bacterium]|nr:PQQ-binding-like beta-propeller repeat protein [Planctomycetota bacterium]
MIRHFSVKWVDTIVVLGLLLAIVIFADADKPVGAQTQTAPADLLAEIIGDSALASRPLMVLHLDCGDASLTAKLAGPGRTIQGLTFETNPIPASRLRLREQSLAGRVSVDPLSGPRLPYLDNLMNVVFVQNMDGLKKTGIGLAEILRVTAPFGIVCVEGKSPEEVSRLLGEAGIPKVELAGKHAGWQRLRKCWPAGMDEWPQNGHDPASSMHSLDTFVGPPTAPQWMEGASWGEITCRKFKFEFHSAGGRAFFTHPIFVNGEAVGTVVVARDAWNGMELWRRVASGAVVALKDRILVSLPENPKKLSAIDAAAGKVIRIYEFEPDGVIYADGVLLNRNGAEAWDAASGNLLWKKDFKVSVSAGSWINHRGETSPGCLVDETGRVFLVTEHILRCLDLKTGHERWQAELKGEKELEGLVACGGGLVFTMENAEGRVSFVQDSKANRILRAYDTATGNFRWEYRTFAHYKRLIFMHGGGLITVNDKKMVELDPATGQEKRTLLEGEVTPDRSLCQPQYTVGPWVMRGGRVWNRMINLDTGAFFNGDVIRGACDLGVIPANGLLYQGVNSCKCNNPIRAVVAFTGATLPDYSAIKPDGRLQKGPAYDAKQPVAADQNQDDWPAWRHDLERTGATESALKGDLRIRWQVKLPASPTAPTVVGDKVVCAVPDGHEVCAVDSASGRELWHFTVGARVDSPPTWHAGRLYFGAHDGYIYCLDSATGNMAWRFQAAPEDRRMAAYGRIESLWPVFGSVAVDEKGTAYAAAGRNSESGGGIFAWALDALTGESRWFRKFGPYSIVTDPKAKGIASTLNNTVSGIRDGNLWLCRYKTEPALLNPATGQNARAGKPKPGAIDAAILGLLDGIPLWDDHYTWLDGKPSGTFWTCNGRLARIWCSHGADQWGIGRSGDSIRAPRAKNIVDNSPPATQGQKAVLPDKLPFLVVGIVDGKEWLKPLPAGERPLAVIRAGDRVCVASTVDDDPAKGWLRIFDAATGEPRGDIALPAAPVFSGMSAARGRLFVALQNGSLAAIFGQ